MKRRLTVEFDSTDDLADRIAAAIVRERRSRDGWERMKQRDQWLALGYMEQAYAVIDLLMGDGVRDTHVRACKFLEKVAADRDGAVQ